MADKKVISIRFHMDNKEDRELYEWLELEAGTSSSLSSVVKAKIKDSYKKVDGNELNTGLQDKLVAIVRDAGIRNEVSRSYSFGYVRW